MTKLRTAVAVVAAISLSAVAFAASCTSVVGAINTATSTVNITCPNGATALVWTAKTAFTLGGKPTTAASMAVGDTIAATYTTSRKGVNTASAIAITKASPSGTPPPGGGTGGGGTVPQG